MMAMIVMIMTAAAGPYWDEPLHVSCLQEKQFSFLNSPSHRLYNRLEHIRRIRPVADLVGKLRTKNKTQRDYCCRTNIGMSIISSTILNRIIFYPMTKWINILDVVLWNKTQLLTSRFNFETFWWSRTKPIWTINRWTIFHYGTDIIEHITTIRSFIAIAAKALQS